MSQLQFNIDRLKETCRLLFNFMVKKQQQRKVYFCLGTVGTVGRTDYVDYQTQVVSASTWGINPEDLLYLHLGPGTYTCWSPELEQKLAEYASRIWRVDNQHQEVLLSVEQIRDFVYLLRSVLVKQFFSRWVLEGRSNVIYAVRGSFHPITGRLTLCCEYGLETILWAVSLEQALRVTGLMPSELSTDEQ